MPPFILKGLHETNYRSKAYADNLSDYHYMGAIEKRATQKSNYVADNYFRALLNEAGFDVPKLVEMYRLTPISTDSVYKDFAKYHKKLDYSNVPWDRLEIGSRWLSEFKLSVLGRKCNVLDYDSVVETIDRSKSATALFNTHFKNKGEVLDSEDFKYSFCDFIYKYASGEATYFPWVTFQKEEIRPGEKIDIEKYRSIIIGSIYSLILGHMLYNDMDSEIASKWLAYGTGIGMSCFGGDYDAMCRQMANANCYGYSDIGQYDSRQAAMLCQEVCYVADSVYNDHYMYLYDMLGSLAPYAQTLKIPNIKVNTFVLRNRLNEDCVFGPIILPRGEVASTDRGEKSGSDRTGPANVDRHKIVEFAAASYYFPNLKAYHAAGHFAHQTGDDKIAKGPDYSVIDKADYIWETLGATVEKNHATKIEDCVYLSTKPFKVKYLEGYWWVPIFNTCKIIAGLASKLGERTLDNDVQRLPASQILSFFFPDRKRKDKVIRPSF